MCVNVLRAGEDREALTKVDRKLTEEEEKKMKQVLVIDGVKRVVEKILGRRKLKSSYEYEVQWVGCHPDQNTYLPRDELVQMGFEKLVNEVDAKEAAAQVGEWDKLGSESIFSNDLCRMISVVITISKHEMPPEVAL
jgi:hypothetical protein